MLTVRVAWTAAVRSLVFDHSAAAFLGGFLVKSSLQAGQHSQRHPSQTEALHLVHLAASCAGRSARQDVHCACAEDGPPGPTPTPSSPLLPSPSPGRESSSAAAAAPSFLRRANLTFSSFPS